MKLSKVLSLVLAIAMLLSMPTFAAFTDVAADANYAEAVTVLSALDIINGYEDGSFKPEGKITRAEYAAIVCRVNNMDDAAKANANGNIFTDVAADHWASGYIATAYQAGIVNGMGDGTFAPEAEVTYEQAVKMLVAALGYEMKAQSMGGYPTGYMMIANQESITVGTTNTAGGASRATVARLTYNALTVPMMDQTSWGTDIEFKPIKTQSLLYTKLNAIKAEVTFATVPLNKTTTDVTLTYGAANCDAVTQANIAAGNIALKGTAKINGVDLTGLQGLAATAIIDKADDSQWKLICVVPKAGKNVEISVDPEMMAEVNAGNDGYVEYYKTNDDDRTTKIKVPVAGLTYYKNLVAGTSADVAVGGNAGDLAYRFVDTDNDGTYETVFVDNVAIFVVGNVNAAAGKIYRDSAASSLATPGAPANITLDPEDENLAWTIADSEGNALELADIEAGSIVAVATSTAGSDKVYEITVINETVEGTIGETYDEIAKVGGATLKKFKISDADYMMLINPVAPATLPVAPGDSIIAKVFGNKVVAYEVAEGVKNYGLIINTNLAQDFGDTYQLQVLTQKGEIITLNLAEKVNGATVSFANQAALDTAFPAGMILAYEVNSAGELKEYDIQNGTSITSNVVKATDDVVTDVASTYKESSEKLGSYYITDNTVVFTTETVRGSITKTNVALSSKDILAEDTNYTASVLFNEDKEALVVVLLQAANQVNMNSFPLVVTKKATVNVDNDTRTKLFGYVNGEEVELIVAENADATVTGLDINDIAMYAVNGAGEIVKAVVLADYTAGTGFVVADNAIDGVADDAKAVDALKDTYQVTLSTADYTVTSAATADSTANTVMTKGSAVAAANKLKGFGVAGKAYSIAGKNFRIMNADNYKDTFDGTAVRDYTNVADDDRISDYAVNSNAVAYKFNAKNGKFTVTTALDCSTDVNTFDKDHGDQMENDDLVYAYNFDGETKLVLIVDVKGN